VHDAKIVMWRLCRKWCIWVRCWHWRRVNHRTKLLVYLARPLNCILVQSGCVLVLCWRFFATFLYLMTVTPFTHETSTENYRFCWSLHFYHVRLPSLYFKLIHEFIKTGFEYWPR